MRLGIIIIVSIATTSCNSIKEEPSDGTTLATNESVSGRKEPKQQNFTYEVTANQRKHVDEIIEGFEALGVISAENKQSCFTLSRIGKYETDENGTKRIQIFMVFDELAHYTILGSTVSPDQVQVNGNSDRTRIGSTEECLQSTAGPVLVDVVTEARGNESAAVVDDSEMDKNVTAFAKHDGDTVAEGGRLTRHQVLVISTCSAILGTFFVVAAILRIRNYIKRVREEREAARLPAFRSCSVALRSANNSDQREEVSRKESTGSKTSKQSNHGNKQTVTIDYGDHKDDLEENPLLTVTSLSAPASPVFIRNEFSELTEKDSDNGEQPSETEKEPEMVCNDNNDDDDGESDNEGEYECEMVPLVKQPTILEDISEVSEHSSPARHSISMMEETLLQHVNNNALPSVTIPKPPDHVVVNVNNPQNESALYNDPGLPGLGLTSLTQSDLSVSSLNPSYKYGNQTEYISGGGYGNFAYSPVEEVHIPMLQDDIEHKMLESPDLPEPPSFSFSPIVPIPCLNSPDESHNGVLNSSSSDETSQISSSSRESSDSSPRASRIEQDPLSDYSFYQQSISDRLNEMNDELFDDMLGPDEDRSIRMAELSEFSSLPTIPESSRENTDAEDYEARVEYPLGRNSWMSNRSYSSDSHDSRGRVTSQPVEQKHPSTNINGSVPKKPTQEPQKDAKIPNMPQFVGNDNSAYDNDHESSDDLDLSDEGQGHSHMHLMDERTLLLSSFEGMESTLV